MNTHPSKVLLVDDEPMLLDALALGLGDDEERFEVLTANNADEALELMDGQLGIDVVVADLMMPGTSGMDLIEIIRGRFPDVDAILMTGHGTDTVKRQATNSGCSFFIEKPFLVGEMKRIILELLDRKKEGFAGVLKNIPLPDLIQMCCVAGTSMAVRVKRGAESGVIHIQKGEVIHASTARLTGEEAFYRILSWETGSFETLGPVYVESASMDKNWQYLLMEAARQADEKGDAPDGSQAAQEAADASEASPARVLIVDDSAVMRRVFSGILVEEGRITVAGTAKNGEEALGMIEQLNPDVITLDVNMPVMDGGTALKHIMIKSPIPVVIISSVSERSHENILSFLRLGAVDFVAKPGKGRNLEEEKEQIIKSILAASTAKTGNFIRVRNPRALDSPEHKFFEPQPCSRLALVVSGAGGHGEVIRLVPRLEAREDLCIVVLQDMPLDFVDPFAGYLDGRSPIPVQPLTDGCVLAGPCCYVGSTRSAISLEKTERGTMGFRVAQPAGSHGGAALDCLARACADQLEIPPVVALLSGARMENLDDLEAAKEAGANILVQNPKTSMVSGPLEEALGRGLAESGLGMDQIVAQIMEYGKHVGRG